ncbi:PilZ domain-containing protein [Tardiphaga sp.]|jgi:hypothetical protein|uniref:PilZ domain-containing protein n=1 Tax=Tardiphaga sp. TaxID=1926292 RepID=UPI0037DA0F48
MAFGKRKSERVVFARGIPVRMVSIDGTWTRNCLMVDASNTGARLTVGESLAGLDIKEFFLLLSTTGLAYRRCRMVRLAGDQIGIEFISSTRTVPKIAAARLTV